MVIDNGGIVMNRIVTGNVPEGRILRYASLTACMMMRSRTNLRLMKKNIEFRLYFWICGREVNA